MNVGIRPRIVLAPVLAFHNVSMSVRVFVFLCFCVTILALPLNSNKESGILVSVAASARHAKISCLLG